MAQQKINVGKGGVLLPAKSLGAFDAQPGDVLDIVQSSPRLLTIGKVDGKGTLAPPTFCGDTRGLPLADLVSLLNMTQKTGKLVFDAETYNKYVHFQRGEVIFAGSSLKEDRLGNILYKTGMLTKKQLETAESKITPDKRFGAVLVEEHLLNSKDLWEGVRYQIEEIVYSLFTQPGGWFAFYEGESADEDVVGVALNTQHLLMEGFQRLDEFKLIAEKIPDRKTVFQLANPIPDHEIDGHDKKLIALVDGKSDVDALIRSSRLGEFNTLRSLFRLLKMGFLDEAGAAKPKKEEAKAPEESKLQKIAKKYNMLLAFVFQNVEKLNPGSELLEETNSFFSDVSEKYEALFKEIQLDESGQYDAEMLLANADRMNVSGSGGGGMLRIAGLKDLMIEGRLLDGLNELLNFTLFAAGNLLDPAHSEELTKEVRKLQKKFG